mgnify:FL=1
MGFGSRTSTAIAVLKDNTVRFTGSDFDTIVPFSGASYAHGPTVLQAANAFATMNQTDFDSAGTTTYLDKAMESFRSVIATQWDSGFIPLLSFPNSSSSFASQYINDVPSPKMWKCSQPTSWLASVPFHGSTALRIYSWTNLNHTDSSYKAGIDFLQTSIDALDKWHTFLATNRAVSKSDNAALEGLLYIVHPWESADPFSMFWSSLMPEPAAGCTDSLPAAAKESPFWGGSYTYCQALALIDQLQSSADCNPSPGTSQFAVVDPLFNVAFHDSVASLKRICDFVGNCSSSVLGRIDQHLQQVTWSKLAKGLRKPLSSGLMGPLLSWYQARSVKESSTTSSASYRASDASVLMMYGNVDSADNVTDDGVRSAVEEFDAAISTSSGAAQVCAQVLSAPVQSTYPVATVASVLASTSSDVTVSCPSLNLLASRALQVQNYSGTAYTIRSTTLAVLDAFLDTNERKDKGAEAAIPPFPYAFESSDYTQCYSTNKSCNGMFAATTASASAYTILALGDAPTPQAMANIGLLGTEIFIGVELFVMVVIAIGFLYMAVRLLRQVLLASPCAVLSALESDLLNVPRLTFARFAH